MNQYIPNQEGGEHPSLSISVSSLPYDGTLESIPSFIAGDELPCWFNDDELSQALSPWINNEESFLETGSGCFTKVNDPDSNSAQNSRKEGKKAEDKRKMASSSDNKSKSVHNQNERKRREKISERIKTLYKMLPISSKVSKMDTASMLEEVIKYIRQGQAYIHMMDGGRVSMMSPLAMQQQFQMFQMGMGMEMMSPIRSGVLPPVLYSNSYMAPTWNAPASSMLQQP